MDNGQLKIVVSPQAICSNKAPEGIPSLSIVNFQFAKQVIV